METEVSSLYHDHSIGCLVRVVHIDWATSTAHLFVCRDKINECEMPYALSLKDFSDRLKDGSLVFEKDDPYLRVVEEKDIKPKEKKLRDSANNIISFLILPNEGDIFSKVLRNALVKRARIFYRVSKPTLYKCLKKYWRNGMNSNALLPNFAVCGAPGKERQSETPEAVKLLCQKGYKKFHVDKGYTIRTAYDATIKEWYNKSIHGKKFSWSVFWEHGRRPFLDSETIKRQKGDRDFENNIRALKGRSLDMVTGPCQLYQIDSTTRDIKIVASFDSTRFIGRPTFYVIRDVFTRAVVGIYITLDPPSYIAACTALYHAFTPKKGFIEELGLSDKHLGWSNHFLPTEIVADRAEFLGPKADSIVNNLGIRLGNTPAYRPWMKGDVEKMIDILQSRVRDNFLGHGQVLKGDPRITKDTNQEATVTLKKLLKISWIVANEFNNKHWINGYPLTVEMARDRVDKIPAEIHKWAIKNCLGIERTMSREKLYLSLLDAKEVSQGRPGILLNGQHFVPATDEAFKLWENLLTSSSCEKVSVVYDPRNYKNIFWRYKGRFHKLRLRGEKDAVYENEWEAISVMGTYSEKRNTAQSKEQDVRNNNNTEIEGILKSSDISSPRKTKNARYAKKIDRAIEHYNLKNPVPTKLQPNSASVVKGTYSHSPFDTLIDELNA